MAGEEWIGASLIVATPSQWRGYVVLWLYYSFRIGQISPALFRDLLGFAWEHDDIPLKAAASRDVIRSMFLNAEFPPRPDLTPTTSVTLWRGTAEVSLSAARCGFSWTTHRDYACWHAVNHVALRVGGAWAAARRPFVIKANVAAAELIFLPNERSECEALYFGGGIGALDGCEAEWRLSSQRWEDTPRIPSTRPLPMPIPRALGFPGGPEYFTEARPWL